jgi:cytochrome subunit of sulfide dehydrogenase
MVNKRASALAAIVLLAPTVTLAADPRLLAGTCTTCHGSGGTGSGAVPSLKGRNAASVADAMRAFRDGSRPATVMGRLAKGFSDDEIDAMVREIEVSWR